MNCAYCQKAIPPEMDCSRLTGKCYGCWQDSLSADHGRHLSELTEVCRVLRSTPAMAKRIAKVAIGKGDEMLRGEAADVFGRVKKVLSGPYGGSMELVLTGWNNATSKDVKERGSVDD